MLLPDGKTMQIPIFLENGLVGVRKDSGDDPDITNGITIFAKVQRLSKEGDIVIKGGKGVGYVTKPGLQVPVGHPAINPIPAEMIKENVRDVIKKWGMEVEIIIPEGERIAKKTFNERVGVMGGLSIIGTTGIVKPMSIEALMMTIKCEMDVAIASGYRKIGLVPGRLGEESLKKHLTLRIPIVQMGNFAGFALGYAAEQNLKEIILGGHPGKLAKIAMGYFNTHSSRSPQATSYVADFIGLSGNYNTVEEIIHALPKEESLKQFSRLASKIADRICEFYHFLQVYVFLFDMQKNLIGQCGR